MLKEPRAEGELHQRLVWLTFFRLATVSVLFASTLILGGGPSPEQLPEPLEFRLLAVAGLGFLATLGFAVLLRSRRWLTGIAYAEITADVALAGILVLLTGGSSVFSFVFILAVVNAALVLSQRGAMLAAALSSLTFFLIKVGLNERWVLAPASFLTPPHEEVSLLLWHVCINLSAFFLFAAVASYVTKQLQRTGEQLSARELDIETLTALHQSILASIPSGIATVDNEGRVTFVNRAGWQICRPWQAESEGLDLPLLLPGVDIRPAREERQEVLVETRNGERRWLGLTVSELRPVGSAPHGWVVVFQDLTDLHRLEDEARRNERLAAVGKLAAGLAHELRNPLASMSGAVQMLAQTHRSDPDDVRLADIVVNETERLNRLVSDFLGFAKPSPQQPALIDLGEVVGQTLDIMAHGPSLAEVNLQRQIEPGVVVVGDASQLRQACWNLVLNAAQAVPPGVGTVSVAVRGEAGGVRIDVEDNGPGVPAQDLVHLFEPFFTTKAGGTGLGLSTVRAIVESHGGRLDVANREPLGARFSIHLPAASPAPGEVVAAAPHPPATVG